MARPVAQTPTQQDDARYRDYYYPPQLNEKVEVHVYHHGAASRGSQGQEYSPEYEYR